MVILHVDEMELETVAEGDDAVGLMGDDAPGTVWTSLKDVEGG